MRPEEKWNRGPKDPKEKRKRRYRPRGERASARNTNNTNSARSEAGTPTSDTSTPQDTATEAADRAEGDNEDREGNISGQAAAVDEPELPPMPRRAISAEPTVQNTTAGLGAALLSTKPHRAVRSSPIRPHGSDVEPIEIDVTPKPLRRQLFSPQNLGSAKSAATASSTESSRPLASLPNFVRRSPRINKTKEVFEIAGMSVGILLAPENKENRTPARELIDGLDDLFDDPEDDVQLPPMTPTPTRRSDRLIFKTPSKTPTRTAGAMLSPNVQRSLHKSVRHPAAAALLGSNKNVADMTPFTKQIHQLLSDAVSHHVRSSPNRPPPVHPRRTPKKSSPKNAMEFDFPDLPSLNNSSPMSQNRHINFDFSELTTERLDTDYQDQDVPSTDAPIPSSPPPGFFNFVDTHDDGMNGLWSEMDFGSGQVFTDVSEYPYNPMESAALSTMSPGLRRSPRNR